MTALNEYEKLEATALWRESLATQRREVIVHFGDTSLMITDGNEEPLSHWSLPAVRRLNPGQMPAVFSPNPEGTETLEISDETMALAIEKVLEAIDKRRPHPGRLRLAIFLALTVIILALGVFWLPGALVSHTVRVVPPEKRQQIGLDLLIQITRLSGNRCSTPRGNTSLARLEDRLFDDGKGTILVFPEVIGKSSHLPGGFILLNRSLVEDFDTPEVLAGYVLIEQVRAADTDPLVRLLEQAGLGSTLKLLTTGDMDEEPLKDYAQFLLTNKTPLPNDRKLLEQFEKAGFSSEPLAYEIDLSGETTLTLIEANPMRGKTYSSLLSDSDWVSLQDICGG